MSTGIDYQAMVGQPLLCSYFTVIIYMMFIAAAKDIETEDHDQLTDLFATLFGTHCVVGTGIGESQAQ